MKEIKAGEESLVCRWCGEAKADVRYRIDPYSYEINDDDNTYPLCDGCSYSRAMDI